MATSYQVQRPEQFVVFKEIYTMHDFNLRHARNKQGFRGCHERD